MRLRAGIVSSAVVVLAACGWAGVLQAQSSLLTALGIQETAARREAIYALTGGHPNTSLAAKAFLAAPPATRVTMIQNAIAWAKAYTESAAFKTDYEKQRASNLPTPPKFKGTVDEELAAQQAERRKNLETSRKSLEKLTPDVRAQVEAALKQSEAQMAKMDSDPQMVAMQRQAIESQRADAQKAYDRRMQDYDKKYPADPKTLIARRIGEFLDLTKDIDFAAPTKPRGRHQVFVSAQLEAKPSAWKTCFRAGKDVTGAARTAAAAWLASLK